MTDKSYVYPNNAVTGTPGADMLNLLSPGWDGTFPWLLPFNPDAWAPTNLAAQMPEVKADYDATAWFRADAPTFDLWAAQEANCYVYALGDREMIVPRLCGRSNVGAISGGSSAKIQDKENVLECVEKEGLILTGDHIAVESGFRPVALFYVGSGRNEADADYHWLRLDVVGQDAKGPRVVWSDMFRDRERPRALTFVDPRKFSFSRSGIPRAGRGRGNYNFLSFVNVPAALWISAEAIQQNRARVHIKNPDMAQDWDEHLKRGNFATNRAALIPQHG